MYCLVECSCKFYYMLFLLSQISYYFVVVFLFVTICQIFYFHYFIFVVVFSSAEDLFETIFISLRYSKICIHSSSTFSSFT